MQGAPWLDTATEQERPVTSFVNSHHNRPYGRIIRLEKRTQSNVMLQEALEAGSYGALSEVES